MSQMFPSIAQVKGKPVFNKEVKTGSLIDHQMAVMDAEDVMREAIPAVGHRVEEQDEGIRAQNHRLLKQNSLAVRRASDLRRTQSQVNWVAQVFNEGDLAGGNKNQCEKNMQACLDDKQRTLNFINSGVNPFDKLDAK